jgi:dCMP deaminase
MPLTRQVCYIANSYDMVMSKRTDYISWDEYFMGVALLSGRRSKDPSTQVGACIVNGQNKIVGAGYNGLPLGCNDDHFPWGKTGDFLDTKYPYVCHAELNAILNNIGMSLHGCRIYTALFPCNECTKAIIQSGIREVIFLSDKYAGNESFIASKRMLDTAGITYRKVETNIQKIELSFADSDV